MGPVGYGGRGAGKGGGGGGGGAGSPAGSSLSLPGVLQRCNSHGSAASAPLFRGAGSGGGDEAEDRLSVRSYNSGAGGGGGGGAGAPGRGAAATLPLPRRVNGLPAVPHPGLGSQAGGKGVLPALANNWVMSPSQTPPGHDGGVPVVGGRGVGELGAGGRGGPLEVLAAPALRARGSASTGSTPPRQPPGALRAREAAGGGR